VPARGRRRIGHRGGRLGARRRGNRHRLGRCRLVGCLRARVVRRAVRDAERDRHGASLAVGSEVRDADEEALLHPLEDEAVRREHTVPAPDLLERERADPRVELLRCQFLAERGQAALPEKRSRGHARNGPGGGAMAGLRAGNRGSRGWRGDGTEQKERTRYRSQAAQTGSPEDRAGHACAGGDFAPVVAADCSAVAPSYPQGRSITASAFLGAATPRSRRAIDSEGVNRL
jgi:hypothetical protein